MFRNMASSLVKHARGQKPVAHDALDKESAPDLKFMAREFASSLHFLVRRNGRDAMVNVWSQEPGAFPPEAIDVLGRVAERLAP